MKTHTRHPTTPGSSHSHSHSHSRSRSSYHRPLSQTSTASKSKTSTTPLASPRATPHSVGQTLPPSQPPKLSPGRPTDVRASSPNYFGLVVEPSAADPRESSGLPRDNWSNSPSSIRSFTNAIPKQVPLDANPEFEAFRRQVDLNRGKSLSLATSHLLHPTSSPSTGPGPVRPRPSRWHTHASDSGGESYFGHSTSTVKEQPPSAKMDVDNESSHDSAYVSADSKRNSESSLLKHGITGQRFESPRPIDPAQYRSSLTRAEDRDPRLSVMEHRLDPPSPSLQGINRAATLPSTLDPTQPIMISAAEFKELVEAADNSRMLLLDIRSSQNYAQSRIRGALNLCIPTTLLKRATFNIHKLQQTFQQGPESERFSNWRGMDCIIVYDAHSSDKRDAVTAQNMIKKFTNEGYSGKTCILRGGFTAFQERFPEHVDTRSTAEIAGRSSVQRDSGSIAPVIGGVMLPSSGNSANPFFSNIRQNMDLADGVGQLDVSRPNGLDSPALPRWLREAASSANHGKKVSDKFLHIERSEQSRMRSAYSAFNLSNPESGSAVQLCGVEKGGKNRYKDILPFEHARVRLENKPSGVCDYINASHLNSSRSNKRYIATQGPLPATFEDFWCVIWEQDVRVIVMLTAESEGGQLKCHPYWKGRDFGQIRLKLLSEKKASLDIDKYRADSTMSPSSQQGDYIRKRANTTTSLESSTPASQALPGSSDTPYVIIRKFALSHASFPFAPIREITHLHFSAWPDFGTPAQPSHLLALVELSNVMQRAAMPLETASIVGNARKGSGGDALPTPWFDEPESDAYARPMLVHCSAGCGRTGTFCTVDSVLDMLKRQRQARAATTRARDSDGDIAMAEDDDPISPMTTKQMHLQLPKGGSPRRSSVDKRTSVSAASGPADTTWLGDDTVDLIEQTVEGFREQRLSMVQSLRQYVLCYETVLEWVHRIHERSSAAISTSAGGTRGRSGSLQQIQRE